MGTCAGLILLAEEVEDDTTNLVATPVFLPPFHDAFYHECPIELFPDWRLEGQCSKKLLWTSERQFHSQCSLRGPFGSTSHHHHPQIRHAPSLNVNTIPGKGSSGSVHSRSVDYLNQ